MRTLIILIYIALISTVIITFAYIVAEHIEQERLCKILEEKSVGYERCLQK